MAAVLVLIIPMVFLLRTISNKPINPAPSTPIAQAVAPQAVEGIVLPDEQPLPTFSPTRGRVTLLVMGLDRRQGESILTRTDTMMLLSIDPRTDSAAMISIPRDLLVEISGYRPHRINAAFLLGAQEGGEERGAELAMQTVESNLGIQIDHYVLLDFDTVQTLVDSVGGVEVVVPKTINDPQYPDGNYGYDPLYIEAGSQSFDGEMALKYMRSRHGNSDFDRAARQQQVALAYRQQLVKRGIRELVTGLPTLIDEIYGGFYTDLTLEEVIGLAQASTEVTSYKITMEVLDYDYVESRSSEINGSVLILRQNALSQLHQKLFQ
ncbi:MAG: LCP family protein [Candidatus Promineifilaceae bacterium]